MYANMKLIYRYYTSDPVLERLPSALTIEHLASVNFWPCIQAMTCKKMVKSRLNSQCNILTPCLPLNPKAMALSARCDSAHSDRSFKHWYWWAGWWETTTGASDRWNDWRLEPSAGRAPGRLSTMERCSLTEELMAVSRAFSSVTSCTLKHRSPDCAYGPLHLTRHLYHSSLL